MASPFELYRKINEEVFSIHPDVTMKLSVTINSPVETRFNGTVISELHNEFVTDNGLITTNIKYRYNLSLSPKRFYKFGVSLDWDTYPDFVDFVDDIVDLLDERKESSPFKTVKNEFGETVRISCDASMCKSIKVVDIFGNRIDAFPIVLTYRNTIKTEPGIKLVFGEQPDLSYEIPIKRFRGLQYFLKTYNPLNHASNMINYLVSTPLLGTNRKKVK